MRQSSKKRSFNTLQIDCSRTEPHILSVVLRGELDASTYKNMLEFTKNNLFSDQKAVIVDTKDLTYMDSSGIKFLSFMVSRFGAENVAVFKASIDLKRLISIVGFDNKLTLLDNLSELRGWRFQERKAA